MRRQLPAEDCSAFEEHYFQCDECFESVQEMERFVAGIGYAAQTGLLHRQPERRWLIPAFAFTTTASAICAAALFFLVFVRLPDREARMQRALTEARESRHHLAESEGRAAVETGPEANVPVAILEANRSGDAGNRLVLGPQSRSALLWIDVPQQPAGTRFGITLSSLGGGVTKSIHGLERNSNGALAASLPASELPGGSYAVRLFNEKSPGQTIAEYRLTITRR